MKHRCRSEPSIKVTWADNEIKSNNITNENKGWFSNYGNIVHLKIV